jgi:hypothetical protein
MKDKYGREVKLVKIQGKYYEVYSEIKSYTRYKRNPKTGRWLGRFSNVPRQYSDNVRYVQIKRPVDVNSDGIIDLKKGQIIGRLAREIKGKPSSVQANVHISNRSMLKEKKRKHMEYYNKKLEALRTKRNSMKHKRRK